MQNKIQAQYDSLYAHNHHFFQRPAEFVVVGKIAEHISSGSVLDIGCGEGQDALVLARQGFAVTAIDLSPVAISNLQTVAAAEQLHVDTAAIDVTKTGVEDLYDGVLCAYTLHHLSRDEAMILIADAQAHTNVCGVHVVTTLGNAGGLFERNVGKDTQRFYPDEATMRELYAGWDIKELTTHQTTTYAKDKQGNRMQNEVVTLVAIKPEA